MPLVPSSSHFRGTGRLSGHTRPHSRQVLLPLRTVGKEQLADIRSGPYRRQARRRKAHAEQEGVALLSSNPAMSCTLPLEAHNQTILAPQSPPAHHHQIPAVGREHKPFQLRQEFLLVGQRFQHAVWELFGGACAPLAGIELQLPSMPRCHQAYSWVSCKACEQAGEHGLELRRGELGIGSREVNVGERPGIAHHNISPAA